MKKMASEPAPWFVKLCEGERRWHREARQEAAQMPGQTSRKVTSRARVYPSLSATAGLLQWTRLIGAWTPAAALPEQWIILLLRGCEIPVNPATNSLPYLPDPERPLAKHCRKRPLAPRCRVVSRTADPHLRNWALSVRSHGLPVARVPSGRQTGPPPTRDRACKRNSRTESHPRPIAPRHR